MKNIEDWSPEDYRHGYEAGVEKNEQLRHQAAGLKTRITELQERKTAKKSAGFWASCFIGLVLGFCSMAIGYIWKIEYECFPIEDHDSEQSSILLKCEDQSSEWVPMPKCVRP